MKRQTSSARALSLGAELRKLRRSSKLSLEEAAASVDRSPSWLSRIETGDRPIGVEDVAALLTAYRVRAQVREQLMTMARSLLEPAWWTASGFEIHSQTATLQTLEARATRITMASIALVPGLLQTVDYARALVKAFEIREEDRTQNVAVRIGRQTVLSEEPRREFTAYLDEAVLHHTVGGESVLHEQLVHLVDRMTEPNITVRMVPFDRNAHTLLDGGFLLFDFDANTPVCYLEQRAGSGAFLHERHEVEIFEAAANKLSDIAMNEEESKALILKKAKELTHV